MSARLPALFLGHGNPLNALRVNPWTRAWSALGAALPRPRAVLSVSAHWYVPGSAVTAMATPRTIHDFGGFPRELYEVRYPAPGDPALAARVQQLLAPLGVLADHSWGLDHGSWSVLRHLFPQADVPIVQLSIDETRPPAFHHELGVRLRPLRDEGLRFEAAVRARLEAGEHAALIDYGALGNDALLSVPTPEHYLPLLYVLGASLPGEPVMFPAQGMDGGSVSMLAVQFG
ncbi:MAG: 4,5-DOPA dioxygenase extradiol [Gammaproteobacteria bacterium]|nr:MAG: 4,5-DOPA dioxygenase extradiol [Gammaproteobacteria bacterium]